METGLLNFHDEETFATSIYDQGDISGGEGHGSFLDMMHSDYQYSSDYLSQSAAHWDSDQEQEHNGDMAVLPVAPSECSSLNSSKEEYNKSLFEWQDSLLSYQPLDPDVGDLRLDSQVIPSELPDNIFEDSFESNSSTPCNVLKCSTPAPHSTPGRCSTPNPQKDTNTSTDASLNLDVSLSALDVNVSDIDVSVLGMNVSSLDIKAEAINNGESNTSLLSKDVDVHNITIEESGQMCKSEELSQQPAISSQPTKHESVASGDPEFAAIFGAEVSPSFLNNTESSLLMPTIPILNNSGVSLPKLESADVEQLHDMAMEFIKEEQQAETWNDLPLPDTSLDCGMDLNAMSSEVPVLEAGNLESLLEKFEATLKPVPEFSQSMPASPAHFSVPPSPLSMPASPSCAIAFPPCTSSIRTSPIPSPTPTPIPSPSRSKSETHQKSSPSSKLHQNILDSLPNEIMDRIKASGRKKTISLIPAMPSKRPTKSGTRMHAAGATLSRNKLLKLVTRKGAEEESIQFDHDYCSSDSPSNLEFVPDKLVMDIQASTKQMDYDEDKSSRKDSGLESGDVSEDSEGAMTSSGCDSKRSKTNRNSILKPRGPNPTGRNKEMLMVSVLKKTRYENSKSPAKDLTVVHQPSISQTSERMKPNYTAPVTTITSSAAKPIVQCPKACVSPPTSISKETLVSSSEAIVAKPQLTKSIPTNSHCTSAEISEPHTKPVAVKLEKTVQVESSSIPEQNKIPPSESDLKSPGVHVSAVPQEQPKKRKLNLEEYHNRLKAMEQKQENKAVCKTLSTLMSALKNPLPSDNVQTSEGKNTESDVKEESGLSKSVPTLSEVKQEGYTEPESENTSEKISDAPCITPVVLESPQFISETKHVESVSEEIIILTREESGDVKPTLEKKKQRHYRTRRVSTSSSEESPQSKDTSKIRIRADKNCRKPLWSSSRSRSRSESSPCSRSRSASRSSSRSSRSDSSSSSGSDGSIKSSRRPTRKTTRRRRRGSTSSSDSSSGSSSRGRTRSRSRDTSSSSRRSNSISSGSSRHSSRRSRRSRSRSLCGSRRDRSTSRSRSWRHRRRDPSRSRRRRFRSRRGRNESWSSFSRSQSRSRSRSRSCRRRDESRSSAGRSNYSCSSRSNCRSRSWSDRSRSQSLNSNHRYPGNRNRSKARKRARKEKLRSIQKNQRRSWRSRSPVRRNVDWSRVEKEHNRQVEERRVIYVGRIPEDTTKAEIRRRFEVFGPIVDISLHFREHADNYGFVTFAYKVDAYEAVERGNDDPTQPRYDLCFGGRRKFCRERYADLDGMACKGSIGHTLPHVGRNSETNSFDDMLREVQAKLQARRKL